MFLLRRRQTRGEVGMNVKITVLKKEFYREIAEAYLTEGGSAGPCPILETGQTFLYRSDEEAIMPEGFCPWAWVQLYPEISRMSIERVPRKPDGEYWWRYPDKTISCCTDGVRPVVFLLERLPEEKSTEPA